MSTGFAGSATRRYSGFDREVETRMKKRLDVFTDDFSPPGASEAVPGSDFKKAPFRNKPHDDISQAEDNSRNHGPHKPMHAAGDPQEQEGLDDLDEAEFLREVKIKPEPEQFPGARMDKKEMKTSEMTGEKLSKEVEKRMAALAGRKVIRREPVNYAGVSAVTLVEENGKYGVAKQTNHGLVDVAGGLDQVKAEEVWHQTIKECKPKG